MTLGRGWGQDRWRPAGGRYTHPVTGHALPTSVFGNYALESIKYCIKTYITHICKHQNAHPAASLGFSTTKVTLTQKEHSQPI